LQIRYVFQVYWTLARPILYSSANLFIKRIANTFTDISYSSNNHQLREKITFWHGIASSLVWNIQ
jgi:hypothetical protein